MKLTKRELNWRRTILPKSTASVSFFNVTTRYNRSERASLSTFRWAVMHYYGVKFVYSSLRYCTLPLAVVLMKTVLCCCSIDLSAVVSMPSKYRICRVVYYSLPSGQIIAVNIMDFVSWSLTKRKMKLVIFCKWTNQKQWIRPVTHESQQSSALAKGSFYDLFLLWVAASTN